MAYRTSQKRRYNRTKPYGKRPFKSRRTGGGRRYRTTNTRPASLLRCPTSFPSRYVCKLSFANAGMTVVNGPGTTLIQVRAANRPFPTALGLQPQGWDSIAGMYLRYRPLAMSLKMNFGITSVSNTTGADRGHGLLVRGYWSQYKTALQSDLSVVANRYTKTVSVNRYVGYQTLSTYAALHNIHGLTRQQWMSDDDTECDTNSQPIRETNYFIHLLAPQSTEPFNFTFDLTGEIWFEFHSPRILIDDGLTPTREAPPVPLVYQPLLPPAEAVHEPSPLPQGKVSAPPEPAVAPPPAPRRVYVPRYFEPRPDYVDPEEYHRSLMEWNEQQRSKTLDE